MSAIITLRACYYNTIIFLLEQSKNYGGIKLFTKKW